MTTQFHSPHDNAGSVPKIERLHDSAALAAAVVGLVASSVSAGVAQRGRAILVFSGGGTPEIFLPQVATLNLPWDKISILLADERWVDEDSPHSNTAMLRRTLLSEAGPAQAKFIALKNAATTAAEGVPIARQGLPPISLPYDLVLLGMGNDGHFASLFSGTPRLAELLSLDNTERVVAIPPPTTANPKVERISLTLAEIKHSERVVLVLQGEAKLEVLRQAWQTADALQTPVFALRHAACERRCLGESAHSLV